MINVHLLRSKEVSETLYWDVYELLQQFKGPVQYISSESYVEYEKSVLKKEIIEDKKSFETSRDLMISKILYKQIAYSMEKIERHHFFPMGRESVTPEVLFEQCRKYRKTHDLGEKEYVIQLTEYPNSMNRFNLINSNMHDAVIHTDDWDYYLDTNAKYPIAYLVTETLLHSQMAQNLTELSGFLHKTPIGCVSDITKNKKDITLKLRTADICTDCQQIIRNKKVSSALVNQVLNTMEGIRQQMLFKERFKYHLKPSRMVFNLLHRKAVLTDIQNLTIRLTPLEAAIYYLFLQKPEGILLNRLDQYEKQLYQIYSKCSVANSDNNIAAMRNSIKSLVNPLENSLNEKISRIKSKFIKTLGEELAAHYIIVKNNNSQTYSISIDRSLVTLKD